MTVFFPRRMFLFLSTILIFIFSYNTTATERIFLSGQDAATAVPWEFKMSTGRNSGYWTTIPVPSNWELQGFGYYTYGNDYEGYEANPEIGSYKHRFQLDRAEGKRYRLTFQGSMTDTKVMINGISAGAVHQGGFMQFSYEITDLVRDGENVLEVEVRKSSSSENVQEAERIADFWLFGGIFRPVYIDVLPGEFIERVAIDARMEGGFEMDVYLDGIDQADMVTVQVFSSGGKSVGNAVTADVSSGNSVIRLSGQCPSIEAWSHEFPHLYRMDVRLQSGDKLVHRFNQKFGFRTFEVRDHDGFYLNNRRIFLKGANMHSIRPETGRALSRADMLENIQIMKDLNFNAVRPCHYPPDDYIFSLCDSLGLLAMDELTGWHNPLDKQNGGRLVKELIVRDVNHPSIVLWGNGNHRAHNPELDEDFFRWDIQQRRPLKNSPKNDNIFEDYFPDFDIVNTTFYPNYDQWLERINGEHITIPNEALHALYDGGGGAALGDYWDAIKTSKVGGGLMIWALFDEGVVRTDEGNRIDTQINKAPDGIVGLQGEGEGSSYTVREVWSPVQIDMDVLPASFDGTLPVANEFTFVNLTQCRFEWRLINFTNVHEAKAGHRIIQSGDAFAGNIPAGTPGELHLDLPDRWQEHDALELKALDHTGHHVFTWRWPIADRTGLSTGFQSPVQTGVTRESADNLVINAGGNSYRFNGRTGVLEAVTAAGATLPVKNFPFIAAKSVDEIVASEKSQGSVNVESIGDDVIIRCAGVNGFDNLTWTIAPDGALQLDYAFSLPQGKYHYAGIGLELPAGEVTGKRWLGEGPSRIWKNRTEGGLLDVWDVNKQPNEPGIKWNYPEFEGYFAPWYWASFRLNDGHQVGLSTTNDDLILGVLNPVNGEDPKNAVWHYPAQEGLYLFHAISAVGAKWKLAEEFGPDSQPTEISETLTGSVRMLFDWNTMDTQTKKFKLEIE
jgi:hypothetical protein